MHFDHATVASLTVFSFCVSCAEPLVVQNRQCAKDMINQWRFMERVVAEAPDYFWKQVHRDEIESIL